MHYILSRLTWYKTSYLSLHMGRIQKCRRKWRERISLLNDNPSCSKQILHHKFSLIQLQDLTWQECLAEGAAVPWPLKPELKWVRRQGSENLPKGDKVPQDKSNS